MTARPWVGYLILATAVLLMLLSWSGTAKAAEHDSTLKLAVIYGAPAALDLGATEWAIRSGNAKEANPFGRTLGMRAGVNVAMVSILAVGTQKLQKDGHRGWARGFKIVHAVVRIAVTAQAVRLARRKH